MTDRAAGLQKVGGAFTLSRANLLSRKDAAPSLA